MASAEPAADTRKSEPVRLGGAWAWFVWALAVVFVVYYFSFQTGYAIVNSRVQEDLGLSVSQVATVAAVYTWLFAICQFFSGALLDRLGAGKILPIAIALVTVGIFMFSNATSYSILLLSQLVIALGACSGFVGAGYVGGQWFGMAKFSFMFGLVQFAASFFSAFNQNVLALALLSFEWRDLFTGIATFGIALFALGALFIRNPTPIEPPHDGLPAFIRAVLKGIGEVARIAHVWVAAIFGALSFGVMLALGVVWGPKILLVRGFDASTANWAASLLWLGLAAGCYVIPKWSDHIHSRKLPVIVGAVGQILALTALVYLPGMTPLLGMALCFAFGFCNAVHMLAFSTAADVVQPSQIGTSAALVNGLMFIVGGVMISRPGMRIGLGLEQGLEGQSLELAQFAARPLLLAVMLALPFAIVMRETYPRRQVDIG